MHRIIGIGFFLLLPLVAFSQSSSVWVGKWGGLLNTGKGNLHIIFEIETYRSEWLCYVTVPEQQIKRARVDKVVLGKKSISLTWDLAGGNYQGRKSGENNVNGKWEQGGKFLELNLEKIEGEWPKPKPQTPRKPYSWVTETVKLPVAGGRIMLAGELNKPDSMGKFPIVILVSGSGPQDRDGSIGEHKPFLILTQRLTAAGFAVLRFDDRGAGKTTGHGATMMATTTQSFAEDVLEMLKWLKSRVDIDTQKIGIIGHSEGGIVAPMVAARSSDVAFMVLLAPALEGGLEINLKQNDYALKLAKIKPKHRTAYLKLHRRELELIGGLTDTAGWLNKIKAVAENWDKEESTRKARKIAFNSNELNVPYLKSTYEQFLIPWWKLFITYQPCEDLSKLEIPMLVLIGEKDVQVDADPSFDILRKCVPENLRTTGKLPGLNHLFQKCDECTIAEYGLLEETLNEEFLEGLIYWLNRQK